MLYNFIHKCATNDRLWMGISFIILGWYLSPLLMHTFYVPTYDNLDSNVVWYKILAESGKIFASNQVTIPNMMNGLPRSSYDTEFNLLLGLYYFFGAKTAYILNELLIHLIAFFSMLFFLKSYIVPNNSHYQNVPSYIGALYFGLLPFWSGAGATIALLPLVTYVLLNIKNGKSNRWEWVFLALLPLYASFVLVYIFYITMAGAFLIYDKIKNKKLNIKLFFALLFVSVSFLIAEYRLIAAIFFDPDFISHRIEFNVFFQEDWWETYRLSLVSLLVGQPPHAATLTTISLPLALMALGLGFVKKRLTLSESIVIWIIVGLSFWVDIWKVLLINKFTIPGIILLAFLALLFQKRTKLLAWLLLFVIFLSMFSNIFMSKHFLFLTEYIPMLKAFNMVRMVYVFPFIFGIIMTLSLVLFFRKLKLTLLFVFVLLPGLFIYAQSESFYKTVPQKGYASFEDYYVPYIFKTIKKKIGDARVVSYGMEPAVSLYNGLYTVDGYSANYPLSYKPRFEKVFGSYREDKLYKIWGSKVYITSVLSEKKYYQKGLHIEKIQFNTDALCELNTSYVVSPYFFNTPELKKLKLVDSYKGEKEAWDIYLYKIECPNKEEYIQNSSKIKMQHLKNPNTDSVE